MNYNEDDKAIKNFIIIFVIVILAVFGIYMLTKYVVVKDNESESSEETQEVEINNSVAIVGTMLNKGDEHYYVMLYRDDDENSGEYLTLQSTYSASEDALPVFTVDLSNALNEKFYDKDNVNLDSDDINELRFGDFTVLEVKKGKIVKSYTSVDKVKKVWKVS